MILESVKFYSSQQQIPRNEEKHPNDFISICKYLLFCSPVVSVPVRSNMVDEVNNAHGSQSVENIIVWCYPTPQQRLLFDKTKLVFLSPWGSGKTMFMIWKAIELAKEGHRVLFLLFNDRQNTFKPETLLFLELQEKFRDYQDFIDVEIVLLDDGEVRLDEIL